MDSRNPKIADNQIKTIGKRWTSEITCTAETVMDGGAILLEVPEVISRSVLVNWLRLNTGVTRLDSAFCDSKTRSTFLALAYGEGVLYTTESFESDRCVHWYLLRNVRVDRINICKILTARAALREQFFVAQGPHIQWVHISKLARLAPESALLDIVRWCPNIQEVSLTTERRSPPLGGRVLAFALACSQLHSLKLDSIDISVDDVVKVLQALQNLRKLKIAKFRHRIPVEVALPTLQELSVTNCQATDATMAAIASNCPLLHTLMVFEGNKITNVGVRAVLQGCPLLRETDVKHAKISLDLRVELAKRARLKSITFCDWPGVDNRMAQSVLKVSASLTYLRLPRECAVDATLAACVLHCPLLQDITICGDYGFPTSAAVLPLFKPGNHLRRVNLNDCKQLGDEVVVVMAQHCPRLEVVWCKNLAVSDHAVLKLAQCCPGLLLVDVEGTAVCDRGATAIATHCSGLLSLSLVNCLNIFDQGVRAVAEHGHKLKVLYLSKWSVEQPLPKLSWPHAQIVFR
jgi:hypothetical protein